VINEEVAVRTLVDYYAAFSTLDVQAFVRFFNEPAILVAPQGVIAAATHDVLANVVQGLVDSLRAKGFGRSELVVRRVERLSDTATVVTGTAVRYKASGEELERVGVTYVMHSAENHWRIAVLITHDPDSGRS